MVEETQENAYQLRKKCLEKIDALKKEIEEQINLRNNSNIQVKEFKKKRDEITVDLKKFQQELNEAGKIASVPVDRREYIDLKQRHKALNWKYQTEGVSMQQEKGIVKELDALEAKILKFDDSRKIQSKQSNLKKKVAILQKKALSLHKKVLKFAEESENYHKKVVELKDKLKNLYDEKKKYDSQIGDVRKENEEAFREVRKFNDDRFRKLKDSLVAKGKEIMEKFRKGEKITADELKVLQETELR